MRAMVLSAAVLLLVFSGESRGADEFERPPISYSETTADNPISRLQARLDKREVDLARHEQFGYLLSVLEALDIPEESQTLVFSKTSLQRHRITPKTPRAIYFNDDIYLGYCDSGDVLEISVADPRLGAAFYSVDQRAEQPAFVRETDNCLQCHGISHTGGIPGHFLRSVFVDAGGTPILSEGSRRVDYTTPIEQRWGGWYVSGKHGEQTHLGNFIVQGRKLERPIDNAAGQNVTDLKEFFKPEKYPTPHSDIVALMVLEHQVQVHNLITKANFATRQALHYEGEMNRLSGEPEDQRRDSTTSRIKNAGDNLIDGLLFVDEAPMAAAMSGTSGFTEMFMALGPRDGKGRSLRDFDLKTRMFQYPCSYLVYSPAFDELPAAMKEYLAERLRSILTGEAEDMGSFAHLTEEDRQAILEILLETKPGFMGD